MAFRRNASRGRAGLLLQLGRSAHTDTQAQAGRAASAASAASRPGRTYSQAVPRGPARPCRPHLPCFASGSVWLACADPPRYLFWCASPTPPRATLPRHGPARRGVLLSVQRSFVPCRSAGRQAHRRGLAFLFDSFLNLARSQDGVEARGGPRQYGSMHHKGRVNSSAARPVRRGCDEDSESRGRPRPLVYGEL